MKGFNRKEYNEFVAGVIYKEIIEREKEWLKENRDTHDFNMKNKMLEEVRALGYNYEYFPDIYMRDHNDPEFLEIAMKYIGCFDNEGVTTALINVIAKKGNKEAAKIILERFYNFSKEEKRLNAVHYDNALARVADKRYLEEYLELLKNPENAVMFNFTMEMLGRWKIEEAKPYFIKYLYSDVFYFNKNGISDLIYTAVDALKYYQDPDGEISKALKTKLGSGDKTLEKSVNKALERIEKNNLKAAQSSKKKLRRKGIANPFLTAQIRRML